MAMTPAITPSIRAEVRVFILGFKDVPAFCVCI
jgi:hypothetical protein